MQRCLLVCTIVWSLAAIITPVRAAVDATLMPKASGIDVVWATMRKIKRECIFPDDYLFMRRVAWVESKFGTDQNTFRDDTQTGGNGIWQMDKIGFDDTRLVSSYILEEIKKKLGVDWTNIQYSAAYMNVPLYNALAARLLMYRKSLEIPPDVASQAQFWKYYYNTQLGNSTTQGFISAVGQMPTCRTVGADILFILDASGSIGSNNFALMKQTVIAFANRFAMGPSATQIAVIVFDSTIELVIEFDEYSTSTTFTAAVQNIVYSAGGTNTHLALNMTSSMFVNSRPLSAGFPRVVLVLTDGQSNYPDLTGAAAARLDSIPGLERYAIGMGSGVDD